MLTLILMDIKKFIAMWLGVIQYIYPLDYLPPQPLDYLPPQRTDVFSELPIQRRPSPSYVPTGEYYISAFPCVITVLFYRIIILLCFST